MSLKVEAGASAIVVADQPTVTFSKGFSWPLKCYLQVHPITSSLKLVDEINALYDTQIEGIVSDFQKSGAPTFTAVDAKQIFLFAQKKLSRKLPRIHQ